jgi:hypothetical protein
MRNFVLELKGYIDHQDWEHCKKAAEKALKAQTYGEEPCDKQIFLYCGKANQKLGYLLIAEQMLLKCLDCEESVAEAEHLLAQNYRDQGSIDQAI